jgi:hypothetical protein
MLIALTAYAIAVTVAAFLLYQKASAKAQPEALSSGVQKTSALPPSSVSDEALKATEKKLADVRAELASQKEKLTSKQKELDELREQQKAKARREGKKEGVAADEKKGPDPRDVEIQSLRKGMAGLESQLNALKRESAAMGAKEADLTSKASADVEGAKKAAETERERRERIESENGQLKATIDELRAAIKKVDARPDVPGTTIDLKSLPTPVVQELARFFRKGEEFERLYTVAQSQLQLEKDRTLEIQRRYFAVCRELAVHAGVPTSAPTGDAVATAEAVIDGEVKIEAKPAEGEAAAEGKKKKRRRRRRKIAGESSEVEAADEGGDDGDDGDADASGEGAPVGDGEGTSGAAAPA